MNSPHRDWDEGRNWPAIGLVVALHAGLLWGLMQIQSVRAAVQEIAPIMVGLITVPPPEPPRPERPPPRRREIKPRPKAQMIAAPTPEPLERVAPLAEPVPAADEPPPPSPPAPPAPPAPVIPPNFLAAYLDNPAPVVPAVSRRLREAGTVMLRVVVNAEGTSDSVEVERSSGYARLDRAAVDAVRRWTFLPAKQGDRAVKAEVLVPISFEIKRS